jgi:hypothetical protein
LKFVLDFGPSKVRIGSRSKGQFNTGGSSRIAGGRKIKHLIKGRLGYYFIAIREDEEAAKMLGINNDARELGIDVDSITIE